jgi:DNA-binding IclR family transcriptional regulator
VVAVLRADKVIYMDSVETDRTVRAISRIGAMLPSHGTAVGKAQLAFLSPAEIERLCAESELPALTPKTLRGRDALLNDLKGVREQGYAVELEECDLEVNGIAAPVRDYSNTVVAAVGIVAPASRLSEERMRKENIAMRVREAASALSTKLGHSQAPDRKAIGSAAE